MNLQPLLHKAARHIPHFSAIPAYTGYDLPLELILGLNWDAGDPGSRTSSITGFLLGWS